MKLLFLISLHLCQVLISFPLKITCFDKQSMLYLQMSKLSKFTRLSLHFILNFNFKSTAQEFRKSRVTGVHAICIFRLLLQCTTVSSGYTSNFRSSPYVYTSVILHFTKLPVSSMQFWKLNNFHTASVIPIWGHILHPMNSTGVY